MYAQRYAEGRWMGDGTGSLMHFLSVGDDTRYRERRWIATAVLITLFTGTLPHEHSTPHTFPRLYPDCHPAGRLRDVSGLPQVTSVKTEFPSLLDDAPHEVRSAFRAHALFKHLKEGERLTLEGDSCHYFPIVHSGVIRVFKVGPNGQEVTLYRIQKNEGCVLTMTCLLRSARFPAYAVVEHQCSVFLIPAGTFHTWVMKFPFWRDFVFSYMTRVITNVISLVEEVAFKKVDLRIMELLVRRSGDGVPVISITHQEIAREVGTAREVVSRILKGLEREDLIQLSRNAITVTNLHRLRTRTRVL